MSNENRIRSNSVRRLYLGLTDEQRIALATALERVRVIEGVHPHANNHDERLTGWFLQHTPSVGTPISLRLIKRDPQSNRITQVIQVCEGAEHKKPNMAPDGNSPAESQARRPPHND